jgi:WD40 repeat protein
VTTPNENAGFRPADYFSVTDLSAWPIVSADAHFGVPPNLQLRPACILEGHERSVNSVRFSPDGKLLVTAAGGMIKEHGAVGRFPADFTVRLWDAVSGRQIACCQGHSSDVLRAVFSPSGEEVISCSQDGSVRIWEVPHRASMAIPGVSRIEASERLCERRIRTRRTIGPCHQSAKIWRV